MPYQPEMQFRHALAHQPWRLHRQAGFTLIELMVVVVISVVLIAVGIPNMTAFVNDSRVSNSANEFIGAMSLARAEAVQRGRLVTVCRSENANNAVPSCAAPGNWNSGWIVFVKAASANPGTFENGDTILMRQNKLVDKVNAVGNQVAVTFNAMGEPTGGNVTANFNFNYDTMRPREVCINRNGRVKVVQGAKDDSVC